MRCTQFTIFTLLMGACGLASAFSPTVTFSCASGPVYTLDVTDGVVGGVIFIEDYCAQQNFSSVNQTFTFDTAACTDGGVPALNTTFYIVVQELSSFAQLSDLRIQAECLTDFSTQTKSYTISTSKNDTTDQTESASIAPVFTTTMTSDGTNSITAGEIGDSLVFVVSIDNAFEQATFGFKITTVTYDGVEVVSSGCSQFSFFPNPPLPTAGTLTISTEIVRPLTYSEYQLTATALAVVMTIQVCNGTCPSTSCSRRKRSVEDILAGEDLATVKSHATLLVYPPGLKPSELANVYGDEKMNNDNEACLSRTPMIVVMACLAIALLFCVAVSGWMYCKLRYAGPKKAHSDGFSNGSYKA